ncbi:AraC family transcriptional regulator [Yimella sp. RIT 621]|uniref:AraC family transcriptional regulator n=1 Tax=Yimella sp. RIT 621 TaxID=2510323 RepID=UPI001459FD56|nr:AraC family transcriptional regulator [Yimella sp. RIT 621]
MGTPEAAGAAPLASRILVRSGDVEELTTVGSQLFSPHRLLYRGHSAQLSASPIGGAHLIRLQYRGDSSVETTTDLEYFAVHLPLRGRSAVRFGQEVVTPPLGGGVVFSPGDRPAMRWSPDLSQLAIRIPAAQLIAHTAMLTGRPAGPRLRFEHRTAPGVDWAPALRTLAGAVERYRSEVLPDRLARGLLEMFMTSLVMTQPSTCSDALLIPPALPGSTLIEMVAGMIEDAPEQPWSLSRMAAESGMSGRSLQLGFKRYLGCSPIDFVRQRRLELVHRRLLDPEYATVSVTQIATDAGFTHLGRFAAEYRRQYGATPSGARRAAGRVGALRTR